MEKNICKGWKEHDKFDYKDHSIGDIIGYERLEIDEKILIEEKYSHIFIVLIIKNKF